MVSWSLNNSLPVYHTEPKDETHPCRLELLVVESGVVNFGLYLGVYLSSPLTWMAAAFGAVVGSFLNVCIFRIPEGTFFKHLRSVCRSCGQPIPSWRNIPLLSWVLQRGRAACCGQRISVQYPLVELITAVAFAVIYWHYPFLALRDGRAVWDAAEMLRFAHGSVFFALMLVCSVIDIRLMIIPDVISLPMIALTPLVVLVHPDLDWFSALLGVLVGGASLYVIAWIYYLIRREVGMGAGDVKLLAGIGGWLGYQAIFPTIFYGSILGAGFGVGYMLVTRKLNLRAEIPFGPFLAAGAWLHLLFGGYLHELLALGGT